MHRAARFFAVFLLMTRSRSRGCRQRGRRGGRGHRRSAHAAARRVARALARFRFVRPRPVAGRAMWRVFLGNAARLVFTVPFAESAAPDGLREVVCDVGKMLAITPEQTFTFTGSGNVKGPRRHHCTHCWRLLRVQGPFLPVPEHTPQGRWAGPAICVGARSPSPRMASGCPIQALGFAMYLAVWTCAAAAGPPVHFPLCAALSACAVL